MTKKQVTFYSIVGLLVGITGGVAGTAFSMGAEKQSIKDNLAQHSIAINAIELDNIAHRTSVAKEIDRYVKIVTTQMIYLQNTIQTLTATVNDLRTDVHVLKAIMERMENDLNNK